jgi:hypothetical protein
LMFTRIVEVKGFTFPSFIQNSVLSKSGFLML